MTVLNKKYITEMPNGEKWAVPVATIAAHRAAHYAKDFNGDVYASLSEDTAPLFEDDEFEIEDWARNNMNWSDVEEFARRISDSGDVDFQQGWMTGVTEVV